MHYAIIKPHSIENGPGIRVSLFVSGCRRGCKGCFNKEAWDFGYGQECTAETLSELDRLLENPNVAGLSILGGDPLEPENRKAVTDICMWMRTEHPGKTIWVWTGYLFEDVKDLPVMKYIDILVDGPFVEELKDLRLKFRGSSNQRIIDVRESLIEDDVVGWE